MGLQISGLTAFDLDNPDKPVAIPTRPGCMHKADIDYDEEHQAQSLDNLSTHPNETTLTETEKKAFHFFDIGTYVTSIECN